ncbi:MULTISPECIES: helix-turn-helix transcriptional regulator [Paraburkholderia]|jgi:predicted DNA-binding transcriptional regulator AlpA|uniref:DNA-binding transcriptional regulator AlpA n=1 Tax=Paraburkholderia caledonica TaxID=134536 RepID=A0AB73IDA5_9BURK|nr:DNA-binding protein [Paraburkholderia caledonica]TCF98121.1 DNA-binding protein [Paraburkholderia strydomiana]MDP9648016.1 putative DNA-binding transcriptional regulator AlpA [Paraburkholderia caledonica]MDR6377741.1 putative DNA-binding transcriptional regulator AlpA [Paraburkholderia caledonica]CAH2901028.1 MAG: Putative DNA-binding protein [uncultured Paraburkholderia sp.]CAH2931787.1 MAG: Putative DNA-binding protein [uncultured Paraburkholderia sp.]
MEYTFTLKYKLAAQDCDLDAIVERLGEAGCDDATIGVGQPGRLALVFSREGTSALEALVSALGDVKEAVPSARLVEAGPDFVGLTDVAEIAGVSRQNMRKLMLSHAVEFPPPVHEGSASVWHLSDVLDWLNSRGGYDINAEVFDVARSAKQINLAKEARGLEPRLNRRLECLVA